jgi:hypothetical protein
MKTITAGSNEMFESSSTRNVTLQKVLLFCGIFSSLFYAGMDLIGGIRWQSYSWISQEFSRLSAIGAPSRPLHLVLSPVYTVLVIAFGLGVWRSTGRSRTRRVIGVLLVVYALVSLIWPQFFPEDLSQAVSAFTNAMHIILTVVTVLSILLQIGFGAAAFGMRFRLYSIGTLLIVLVFGVLAGQQAPAMAAGQPTPWVGLLERINIYSYMLWVVALAVALLRTQSERLRPED